MPDHQPQDYSYRAHTTHRTDSQCDPKDRSCQTHIPTSELSSWHVPLATLRRHLPRALQCNVHTTIKLPARTTKHHTKHKAEGFHLSEQKHFGRIQLLGYPST